jgi:hypothetical protein
MHEPPLHTLLCAIVESIATRTPAEGDALSGALVRRCWPGGPEDRLEPSALPWVKRWGPATLTPVPPACSCAEGRCALCN